MKCNKCNTENPENSKFCTNCGAPLPINNQNNQKPKKSSAISTASMVLGIVGLLLTAVVIGIIPSIIGLILGIIALVCKKPNKGRAVAGTVLSSIAIIFFIILFYISMMAPSDLEVEEGQNVSQIETENTDFEDVEEIEEEEMNELTVGSVFEENGLKITVNEASTDFKDYDNEYGWNTPEDGMKYIMVSFTCENTGDSDEYVSIYDFDCYADNTTMEQVYSLDDNDFTSANLSPERNVSFKTYYAVPENAKTIELEYETNIWTDEKVVIKVQ